MSIGRAVNQMDVRVGQRVRMRRLEIGMSQERLAELLGVTFQQVQKYEKGVNRIAASRLFDIAAALDMPVHRFFEGLTAARTGSREETVDGYARDMLATPEGMQLAAMFAQVKKADVRRRILSLVRALIEDRDDAAPCVANEQAPEAEARGGRQRARVARCEQR